MSLITRQDVPGMAAPSTIIEHLAVGAIDNSAKLPLVGQEKVAMLHQNLTAGCSPGRFTRTGKISRTRYLDNEWNPHECE